MNLDHGKTFGQGPFEDKSGDILGRRVGVHQKVPFSKAFQYRYDWVVLAKDHVVIEILIHP